MSTLSIADGLTPLESAKRFGSKDSIKIIEALSVTNQFLVDAIIQEASDGTVNKTTRRTSEPTGTKRLYNEEVLAHGSSTTAVEDYISMLEDYSLVDADFADHQPNMKALLESEDMAFLAGMGKTQATDLLYGNHSLDPREINGIIPRYNTLTTEGVYRVDTHAGGAGNNSSILLIRWGRDTCHLFYPRGMSDLGVKREWRGKQDIAKGSGLLPCYVTFFKAHYGIAIRDTRAVKRICNLNITDAETGADIFEKVIEARNDMAMGEGPIVMYCNAYVKTKFDIAAMTATAGAYTADDPWGKPVTMFQDIRVRQVDAMVKTETAVA